MIGALLLSLSLLSGAPPHYAGLSLEQALLDLHARGLKIVFTSQVVRPEMQVEVEPAAGEPRQVLAQLLAPHGLTSQDGPDGIVVVVPRAPAAPTRYPAESVPLDPTPTFREEIVVTSQLSLLGDPPGEPLGLSRQEILALPHFGDDVFRALTLLPGVTANDVTAQFHIRGGRDDEAQILLDGQELFAPFHLQDFGSALSVIPPAALSGAELSTGGFSARYGDRMSGVLDLTTVTHRDPAQVQVDVGILGAHLGAGGALQEGRADWLTEVRRGSSDLLGRLLGDEDPSYWDALGKLDVHLGSRHSLRANLLLAGDALDFTRTGEETKRFETEYESSYLWLTHQLQGNDLALETAVSRASLRRDRRGRELEESADFAIRDERDHEVFGLRQEGSFQATPRQHLEWGWQRREYTAEYDYLGTHELDDPIARLRHDSGMGSTAFTGRFRAQDTGVWIADRARLREALTLELGLRCDRHSQTRERRLSPRLNLAWAPSPQSLFRAAWGKFNQSQRPYELQVEDGETAFHPLERAEHRVLGFEQRFNAGPDDSKRGKLGELALRVEVYERRVSNPRPRFENLFAPLSLFPEVENDRVRFAPERSRARGAEIFLRGQLGRRAAWWINYAWAVTEDEIDGKQIPRLFDQTHSVNLDLDLRAGEHWRLNLAGRYHTGWATTRLAVRPAPAGEEDFAFVPLLGRLNGARLPAYHRLDLRASRRWELRGGALDFYVDVQNLYHRRNVAGYDYEIDQETGRLLTQAEKWPGFLPSAGISFQF